MEFVVAPIGVTRELREQPVEAFDLAGEIPLKRAARRKRMSGGHEIASVAEAPRAGKLLRETGKWRASADCDAAYEVNRGSNANGSGGPALMRLKPGCAGLSK